MKLQKARLFAYSSAFCIGLAAMGGTALAQDQSGPDAESEAEDGPRLNVIVVTAQKREAGLQETPISVATVSGEKLAEQGIVNPEELSLLVPNFSIQQDPIGDKINIRGIQSGNNAGLEQSVATFVDGVYRGRGIQTRFSFLDIERVEVLRGPQSTLFGKNTNGGALNITTARPTSDLSVGLSAGYTFDGIESFDLVGHVSGPLSDTVRARFAGKYRDQSEGHVFNIFYNQDEPQIEDYAFRGTIEWDASPDTLVTARLEHGSFDQFGQPFNNIAAGPLALFVDTQEGQFGRTNVGSVNPVLDIGSAGNNEGDSLETSLQITHDFSAGELTLIGAYSEYNFDRECDCDFSAVDVLRFDDREDFDQFSFEARFAGSLTDAIDYTVGGYYQKSNLYAEADTFFNTRADPGEIAVDNVLATACNLQVGAGANPATTRECILSTVVTSFDGTPLAYEDFTRRHFLDQTGEVWALFGQVDWSITDRLTFTGGLRYTEETKDADQSAFAIVFGSEDNPVIHPFIGNVGAYTDGLLAANPTLDPAVAAATAAALDPFQSLGEAQVHNNRLGRSEQALTWSFNLGYDVTDDILLYASGTSGFKAGGFNSFALSADPAEAEYEEEEVLSFELGAKMSFGGVAELNIAIFNADFTDIQTAIFTGSTSFIVQNAAEARSRGIEIDGRWAITDNLLLTGGLSYIDFEFGSFPNAACFAEQLLAFRAATGNPLATIQNCSRPTAAEGAALAAAGVIDSVPGSGPVPSVNDLTGRVSDHTPTWSGSVGLAHDLEISDSLQWSNTIDVNFASSQFRQADLDPFSLQDSYAKVNLSTSIGHIDGDWRVSLIVKNLFNEHTFNYVNDTPLFDTSRQFSPELPRTVAVRASFQF